MKFTLINFFIILIVAIAARLSSFVYFNSPSPVTDEELLVKFVEILTSILFPVAIIFFIARNRTERFKRNSIIALFVGLIVIVTNGFVTDRKEKENVTQSILNMKLALEGKEVKNIPNSSSTKTNAINEFVAYVSKLQSKSAQQYELIANLMPTAISSEMFTSSESLDEAEKARDQIGLIAAIQIQDAKKLASKKTNLLNELEKKYEVNLDGMRQATFIATANTENLFIPSLKTIEKMMTVMSELHSLIRRNLGRIKFEEQAIIFEDKTQTSEFTNLINQLEVLDAELMEYETKMQKIQENAEQQIQKLTR